MFAPIPGHLLIVASSARMLAQAAKNAGWNVLAIDLFADQDTQCHAVAVQRVPTLAKQHLKPSVDYFIGLYAVTQVIYGGGFEYHPESLHYLAGRLQVLGNTPGTFIKLLDKRAFFTCLDSLTIPYPEVCFTAPQSADKWLIKPKQGLGGAGIRHYDPKHSLDIAVYWQKYQAGTPYSVLFLANGQEAQVIGFNTQWTVRLSENQAFMFAGISNSCGLADGQKQRITTWLTALVAVFGLKGLNSLDFILEGEKVWVLEINPRPSASMQLYDADLLTRHIKACQGGLMAGYEGQGQGQGAAGYQIVYAEQDVLIAENLAWPAWCMDIPKIGTLCLAGQPICSIIAHHPHASLKNELLIKQQLLIKQLNLLNSLNY